MVDTFFVGLERLPRHAHTFLWADYVELLCLCSQNGLFSKGNLQAQEQEAEDVQSDMEDDILSEPLTSEEVDDKIAARWDDIKSRLSARQTGLPGWPFELDGDVVRRKYDRKHPQHRLYVSLLIASSLRLCCKKRVPEVTSAFEEISFHWLRLSLASSWKVRLFGAHQNLPEAYTGTLWSKFEQLAEDLSCKLMKDSADYHRTSSGDGGIDLVAWQNMGDKRGNMQVIFGQCACSPDDWESKQLDVTPPSTEAHIQPQHPGAAYCFVPHDLMDNGRWDRAAHVKRTVLIDRRRLLHLFADLNSGVQLPNWTFLIEATDQVTQLAN